MTSARPFRIRTITSFITIDPSDFDNEASSLKEKINACSRLLRDGESQMTAAGFEVQTIRIATNPFGEWLVTNKEDDVNERLQRFNNLLSDCDINFCSLGPSYDPDHTTTICPEIVSIAPGRFSCSANINAGDITAALAAAKCIKTISLKDEGEHLQGGLGNFRFAAASCIDTVPFFPGARAPKGLGKDTIAFAVGLENGGFARELLQEAGSIENVQKVFHDKMRKELLPIQQICVGLESDGMQYLGIDTSLNPSLDDGGSVAEAIECLDEVGVFGNPGTMAAAAAITTSLQSIPDIKTTGYSGLMLPVLEDRRLAELDTLSIQKLLCISSVCGVGIDTVPIPGDVSERSLASLILDVAALACRWNKPLSCRVFPVPSRLAGMATSFDSPYMCNSSIFPVE
mmetsp:Transcript_2693/g.4077  ORF Transcript_2693/g.4077 Transcript_2693/m.4077 type:complete len:401 (+) Transcript_2693:142-1344(+)